ncbi:deoxyribose-phosphate aldolase [Rhizobium sp. TRM96647]|uniref:deoxyribose-phosphate aldolase n=1 Tax=unclassified Rhizobium TaxID=2613769 RepID=UPI0021E9712A|nr:MULTISPECIES: deoxyribose-phosphate aldolase [unclassified Rhizobium]MCV3736362.1 deoxyribose-phosphate aldolase [Rhizobium sp. TRM96647]MCV3758731.1 deoxyribose-phosphate aldolase [Rhizobium sp. TRM96650]
MNETTPRLVAAKALSLLDLTDLSDNCDTAAIEKLCQQANTPFGTTAAICIWPRFVSQARTLLGPDSRIRIATVVNFPSGDLPVETVVAETEQAIADGADEIDLAIPYKALIAGDEDAVRQMIRAVREACKPPVVLKTILETGELKDRDLIRNASHLAISSGADFIKTSTGKVAVNATLEAADIMLNAIRESGRNVGFKPAGGVRTVGDASLYLNLAATIHGPDWAIPSTFRFGASGLLGDIVAVLEGRESGGQSAAY